jgi:hypothetical protein
MFLKEGENVPFLREICPEKKYSPNIGANIGAITGILLTLYSSSTLSMLKIFIYFCFFYFAHFLLLFFTSKKA